MKWPQYVIAVVLVLLIALWVAVFVKPASAEQANSMCVVLLGHAALPEFHASYKGKQVYFCCEHCRDEFESYPELYASRIGTVEDKTLLERMQEFFGSRFWLIGITLVAVLAVCGLQRLTPAPADEGEPSFIKKLTTRKISASLPLLVLTCFFAGLAYYYANLVYLNKLEDDLHFATFHDFGYPPVPRRPDDGNKIRRTFYRGNDERSPRLFNGGNYRTATFHLSLCNETGTTIDYDSEIPCGEVFVRYEIVRAPHTANFLFSEVLMKKMFLTQECDRFLGKNQEPMDRVDLTVVEAGQKWQAMVPIGKVTSSGCLDLRGVIYVCEEIYKNHPIMATKSRIGSRFHYGIRYDLKFKARKLTRESDLAMGALYRTRKLPSWKVSSEEWLSSSPIPEVPNAKINDPKLLGIEDYKTD